MKTFKRRGLKSVLLIGLNVFIGINNDLQAQIWNYDFGTGTGSYVTGSSQSTTFLPAPASGTAFISVAKNGGGFHLENAGNPNLGSNTELNVVASATISSENKFSLIDYVPSPLAYTKFCLLLDANIDATGDLIFVTGDGNMFSGTPSYNNNQIFTGLKWTLNGGSNIVNLKTRQGNTWKVFNDYLKNTHYAFEIFGNNSSVSVNYSVCGTSYAVAPYTQDIWINGVLAGKNITKAENANNAGIDSWAFLANGSVSNLMNVRIDDIYYGNTFPIGLTASIIPGNVSCNGLQNGSADLNVSGVTSNIQYLWSEGSTTEDLTDLAAGNYSVLISDEYGCTYSAGTFVSEPPLPTVPANRRTSDIQDISAMARWNAVPGATYYKARCRETGTTIWKVFQTTNLFKNFSGLKPATNYEWSVRAFCDENVFSNYSGVQKFQTLTQPCNPPGEPSVADVTDNSASFSWTGPVSGTAVHHYAIVVRQTGDSWPTVASYLCDSNSIIAKGLISGANYEWRVRTACDSSGSSSSVWAIGPSFSTAIGKTLSIRSVNLEKRTVNVFPNPASDQITIKSEFKDGFQLSIADIQGKILIEKTIAGNSGNQCSLNLNSLSEGIYFIRIQNDASVTTEKIRIIR